MSLRQFLIAFLTLCALPAWGQIRYAITDLGKANAEATSQAFAINESGQVAGVQDGYAFLSSGGGSKDFGPGSATGINASGVLIGSRDGRAFRVLHGNILDLGLLPGESESYATAINPSGVIIGTTDLAGNGRAILYSSGKWTELGSLGRGAIATAINASGQVVGLSQNAEGNAHAIRYQAGLLTDLGTLGGETSAAKGINASGQIVGHSYLLKNIVEHAFLVSNGKMTDLLTLGGIVSRAFGINDLGEIVGTSSVPKAPHGPFHAFLRTGGTMVDLNSLVTGLNPFAVLESAQAINNSSQIVGYGLTPSGVRHAFLATPVPVSQTISFPSIARQTYGAPPILLGASASSHLPVSYRLVSGPARLNGATLTIRGAGSVTIEASQTGNTHYLPARVQVRTFPVLPAVQTISFPALPTQVLGEGPAALQASTTSGLPVTFNYVSGPGILTGRLLSVTGPGVVTVKATQAGTANIYPAPAVAESVLVVKASQTIAFPEIADTTYGAAALTLKATASSALPVTLTVISGPGTLSGNKLEITGAGTISVQAAQPGDSTRSAAETVTRTFTVAPATQTISFPGLPDVTQAAAPFQLTASASSGLPITYQISGPATLEDGTVTATGVGTVTITATQPGDINRLPARSVSRSFAVLRADIRMSPLFSHHMVLQQSTTLPIWGQADPGLKVTVSIGTRTAQTTADAKGKWRVELAPLPFSTQPLTLTVKGTNTLTFEDVLVGEVWLASGQSNMVFSLSEAANGAAEVAQATDAQIRFFSVSPKAALTPQSEVAGTWQVCTPATAKDFSAVAFYFAKHLRTSQKRPVGLIGAYWKATPAQSWTSLEGLSQDSSLTPYVQAYRKLAETKPVPTDLEPYRTTSTLLYNGMIAPLIPYGIKGVIWYQGEANVSQAPLYRALFKALVTDWRAKWDQNDFPFLYTQLSTSNTDTSLLWPYLREAQLQSLDLPNTAMAVTVDLGDPAVTHPPDKRDVGERLGLAADHLAYGTNVVYSGPIYQSAEMAGNQVKISFTQTDGGLDIGLSPYTAPSQTPLPTDHLVGFTIAGANRIWHPATAKIVGGKIIVSSPLVPNPVAVRYQWMIGPRGNLYNLEGLPASPFRTDTW